MNLLFGKILSDKKYSIDSWEKTMWTCGSTQKQWSCVFFCRFIHEIFFLDGASRDKIISHQEILSNNTKNTHFNHQCRWRCRWNKIRENETLYDNAAEMSIGLSRYFEKKKISCESCCPFRSIWSNISSYTLPLKFLHTCRGTKKNEFVFKTLAFDMKSVMSCNATMVQHWSRVVYCITLKKNLYTISNQFKVSLIEIELDIDDKFLWALRVSCGHNKKAKRWNHFIF